MAGFGAPVVRRRYVIRGRVQGVGFRWWTRQTAEALEIVGEVRNLPDGSVAATAFGTEAALAAFEASLNRGPPLARVDGVEVQEDGGGGRSDDGGGHGDGGVGDLASSGALPEVPASFEIVQ